MVAREPLDHLVLQAASRSDDLGFVAIADLAAALSEGEPVDWRLIGGHMVQLHVYRWGLGPELYRETHDADLGVHPIAVSEARLVERLQARGYVKTAGNRFARALHDVGAGIPGAAAPEAVIDILVPAYTSRARADHRVGDHLVTTEVHGLATALRRKGISIDVEAVRLNGDELNLAIVLPDELSALVLKAYAWRTRRASRDAVDVWRCLEIALVSGMSPDDFTTDDEREALTTIRSDFGNRASEGIRAIADARQLSPSAIDALSTRVRALMMRALG